MFHWFSKFPKSVKETMEFLVSFCGFKESFRNQNIKAHISPIHQLRNVIIKILKNFSHCELTHEVCQVKMFCFWSSWRRIIIVGPKPFEYIIVTNNPLLITSYHSFKKGIVFSCFMSISQRWSWNELLWVQELAYEICLHWMDLFEYSFGWSSITLQSLILSNICLIRSMSLFYHHQSGLVAFIKKYLSINHQPGISWTNFGTDALVEYCHYKLYAIFSRTWFSLYGSKTIKCSENDKFLSSMFNVPLNLQNSTKSLNLFFTWSLNCQLSMTK